MALTKIITNTIDLSSDTTGLKMPTGTSTSDETIQYLVVAGGGGGSGNSSGGGGGGAGGLLSGTTSVALGTNVNVTIGSGGAATYLGTTNTTAVAGSGGNSVFSTITATGGGGAANTAATSASGGSGGGASGLQSPGGSGTSGEGNDGGIGSTPDGDIGGGGGGAGGVGQPGGTRTGATDGQGGVALPNSITGASILYAGGGGGGVADLIYNSTPATAGLGGGGVSGTGGDGGQSDDGVGSNPPLSVWGYPGVPNTGGGGGGGSRSGGSIYVGGGAGGSGTVILRYPTVNTLTVGSGLYGNYSTGTTGLCHWPTTSDGISLFELNNNITDTCGTSTASWSGTPAYSTTAKFGSHSAEFSGGNGGTYIDSGVDPDSYSNWTVSFWVYRTNTGAFDMFIGSVDVNLFNGFLVAAYNESSSGKFDVYLRNASGNIWRTQGGSTKFNTWEHVALTYDGSGSGTTTIYHNGKLLEGITLGSNPATGSFASGTTWCMGSAGTWNNERLNGYMDQTRFYDRVLTAQEIELLYAETSDPTTGVIGSETWSKFLGGTGTVSFLDLGTGTGRPVSPDIGTMRENTTTGKMEIYTGAKGWRALQQTGQDVGVVPSNNFNTVLYAGDGNTTQSISGIGFEADFTWIKDRDVAENHALFDIVRGANEWLHSNNDDAQTTYSGNYGLLSWNGDGFTVGNGTAVNDSGENYVSWNWKAGGAAVQNNDGSINGTDCMVSANADAGFSIIKWTGSTSSSSESVGHGLGKAPELVILKNMDGVDAWYTYVEGVTGNNQYLKLNTTDAVFTAGSDSWGAGPTSSVMGLRPATFAGTSSQNLIMYCWTSIPGYSLIGSYTGTGSATNTPIIYTGFEPAWLMVKRTDSTSWWNIQDNKRNTSNPRINVLGANDASAEIDSSSYAINFYNNGFQIANSFSDWNASGGKFIFMCFAS